MPELIKTNCPRDCYDGCGIVVEVRDRGPHRILGDPEHPVSRGKLCSKCAVAYNGVWQDRNARLLSPLQRIGPKGSGQFQKISWEAAITTIAQRTLLTITDHGANAVLHTHYSGTLGLINYLFPNRFFNALGASEVDPDTICNAAGHVAWNLLFGSSIEGFDPRTAKDAACILVWGANPSHSAPHAHETWLKESPAKVVVVDPVRTETARAADLHLQLRPGSDAALAFALLHCLKRDGKFDTRYIAEHTTGFDEITDDIARATPAWGEAHTGVPAASIEQAAKLYGAGPALLWCGQALQRQAQGGNIMRAVGLLPALTGNIGMPGAGFYYLNVTPLFAGIHLGWLSGADLIREGGKKVSHMALANRLAGDEFRTFFIWNTNPLASAPDQLRLRQAMQREDLFTVVVDPFMTDSARYADIVLPAATLLESNDLTFSYFHLHIGAQSKITEPLGESLPNPEIFRRLARAMNLSDPALFEEDDALLHQMMQQLNRGMDFSALQKCGFFALGDAPKIAFHEQKFETPSGRIEIASSQAEAMGLPRTPQPIADSKPQAGSYRLLTPASKYRLNDSYANDPHLARLSGSATLHINPDDASLEGIREGNAVVISNAVGSMTATAHIDDSVLPGTLLSYKGHWPLQEPDGRNVNFLHAAIAADMGESTSVHSTIVQLSVHPGLQES